MSCVGSVLVVLMRRPRAYVLADYDMMSALYILKRDACIAVGFAP